jgi:hypothetical protein
MIRFDDAVGAYIEKFKDSPPFDVFVSMSRGDAITALTEAIRKSVPLDEDQDPGKDGDIR